uniref:Uncharacterized protein n=1 Tax=Romanomermis culicivorax TaxID=13658 RepID=A0A915HJ66_ROMCU
MIIINNNDTEYIFIQPRIDQYHVIHKRFAPKFNQDTVCMFDAEKDPYKNLRLRQDRLSILNHNNKPIIVELALFVDEKLWRHFSELYASQADQELKTFIVAT